MAAPGLGTVWAAEGVLTCAPAARLTCQSLQLLSSRLAVVLLSLGCFNVYLGLRALTVCLLQHAPSKFSISSNVVFLCAGCLKLLLVKVH